jgi:hypothetical protein
MFQIKRPLSFDPLTSKSPLESKATELTAPKCPDSNNDGDSSGLEGLELDPGKSAKELSVKRDLFSSFSSSLWSDPFRFILLCGFKLELDYWRN